MGGYIKGFGRARPRPSMRVRPGPALAISSIHGRGVPTGFTARSTPSRSTPMADLASSSDGNPRTDILRESLSAR